MLSYYQILNVRDDATKAEIKNQYRKLVRMYHPDINPSSEAEKMFKDINRAAEVLLDDEKRKKYDSLRQINKPKSKTNYSFHDLFQKNQKRPQKNKKQSPEPKKGDDITLSVDINYQEALLGTIRVVNIANSTICPKCMGHKFANGNKCDYCEGLGEITTNKKITVKIPPSIKNKTKLRIKGEGQKGTNGGENGDLYIVVNVEIYEELKIQDNTVYYEAQIAPYQAILGGEINVPTLWGDAMIKIPPLTKANQSFKLVDAGVLDEKTNKKGDEIVKIIIQIPKTLTDEEYRLYEKLKEINLKKNAKI